MSSTKQYMYRPKAMSLESLAISRGIVESEASKHPLIEKLRMRLSIRGTDGSGFSDLQRRFNAMDKDASKTLFLDEFKTAFRRCNLNFSEQEITSIFYLFDTTDKKYIDYEEFMIAIRGPINYQRRQLITKAFQMIDRDRRDVVDPEEIIDRYDPTNHPDVKNGLKKTQEVFRDFLRVFDVSTEVDGKITRNEFENYYFNLSASIERDDYFEQVICNAWRMDQNNASFDSDRNGMVKDKNYRGRNEYNGREYNNDNSMNNANEYSPNRTINRNISSNEDTYSSTNSSRQYDQQQNQNRRRSPSPNSRSRSALGSVYNQRPRSPVTLYENDRATERE